MALKKLEKQYEVVLTVVKLFKATDKLFISTEGSEFNALKSPR